MEHGTATILVILVQEGVVLIINPKVHNEQYWSRVTRSLLSGSKPSITTLYFSDEKLILAESYFIDYTFDEVSHLIKAAPFYKEVVSRYTAACDLLFIGYQASSITLPAINNHYKAPGQRYIK